METERSRIKEEEPSGIIDLTGIDDIDDMDDAQVEEFLDNMSQKHGQHSIRGSWQTNQGGAYGNGAQEGAFGKRGQER